MLAELTDDQLDALCSADRYAERPDDRPDLDELRADLDPATLARRAAQPSAGRRRCRRWRPARLQPHSGAAAGYASATQSTHHPAAT
ncbi:hypothetical protein [Pseudonocardia acidicola]|uniref:Uncharacterized protein n=1 Tax=Pseudonocardia acidicola TaxID=2724939 RepID=A0ABX1S9W8_9PSEU|nr:hypothetical protein [Pseudonocardia acidicola]NMH98365.1 hypothetical protein [Pseudonocardia acidicola]